MKYTMTTPCPDCPFLKKNAKSYGARKLKMFAQGEFPCHKTAEVVEDEETGSSEFQAKEDSLHCAGALIYLEKRDAPNQMMRICERIGLYDRTKLNMEAPVA